MKADEVGWAACRRCEEPILVGLVETLPVYLSRWTVPLRHAYVLAYYRLGDVYVVRQEGWSHRISARSFVPSFYRRREGDWLCINHACGRWGVLYPLYTEYKEKDQ